MSINAYVFVHTSLKHIETVPIHVLNCT